MSDEERVLSAANVGELLGITKQGAPDEPSTSDRLSEVPDGDGDAPITESPEPDVPEIPDTNVNQDLKRAVEQQEQRDANLLAAGVLPPRSAAKKREDDRAFFNMVHPPNTDDAA